MTEEEEGIERKAGDLLKIHRIRANIREVGSTFLFWN